jgi:polar amino acid transport system substrate-binding protein
MQFASPVRTLVLLAKASLPVILLAFGLSLGLAPAAESDTLDKIKAAGKVVLGYREDANPFAFKDASGKPDGFSVALCQKIADDLKTVLGMPNLAVEWSPVAIADRTAALQQGRVDILCGADSVSLKRRAEVSFSIPIYPGGIGAIASANAPQAVRDTLEGVQSTEPIWRGSPARILNQRTFAVVTGSTAEKWLAERAQRFQIDVKVIPVENYAAGIKALTDGEADVLFGDRSIIINAAAAQLADGSVVALERQFTRDPIALSIARDNDGLRLAIDSTLSRTYRGPDFRELYVKWFGSGDIRTLLFYELSALPE